MKKSTKFYREVGNPAESLSLIKNDIAQNAVDRIRTFLFVNKKDAKNSSTNPEKVTQYEMTVTVEIKKVSKKRRKYAKTTNRISSQRYVGT